MDLNYLFYRQQIERSLAESAGSEEARRIHAELANEYDRKISSIRNGQGAAERRPITARDFVEGSTINPTMALAVTAREVAR